MQFKNRFVECTIELGEVAKIFKDIKIDFNVTKSVGGAFDNAQITLTGLSLSDIEFLSTNFDYKNQTLKKNAISLRAGYTDNNAVIFTGTTINATPNVDKPDVSIQLEATAGYIKQISEAKSIVYRSTTLREVCQEIADTFQARLVFDVPDVNIGAYSFIGTPYQQIEELRKFTGDNIKIYITDDAVVVEDISLSAGKQVTLLNGESGLIGSPQPTFLGANIKTLLLPYIKAGDIVRLDSKKLSNINSLYRVVTVKHGGSNRDGSFNSILEAQIVR